VTELQHDYDVVILGGGLAALSLVRLLQRELPQVRALVVDKAKGPTRKVGESTVEIAGHFVHARLGLGDQLRTSQLPKHGIRYWFDSADHDLPYSQASEDGPASTSWWHTFQLERDTLESTLLELNAAAGGTHLLGARVSATATGDDGLHTVDFEHEGESRQVRARWLVDATGPGSVRGRQIGLLKKETRIPHGSAWGWFKGGRTPEELIGETGKRRFCFGRRLLATNSHMFEGYWVWMIPLASGLLSLGVVYDSTCVADPPKTQDELLTFLRQHRMLRDALEGAELVDFGRMENFAQKPSHYVGADRTAWIGTAAGFVDPLYSSGLDFIALQCEYLVDLLRRDAEGEAPDPRRLAAYNGFLEQYFEQTVRFFSGLYKTFVSQELVLPRYRRDVHIYWNLYTWPYFSRQFLELEFLEQHGAVVEAAMQRSEFFARLFSHTYERLKAEGNLYRANKNRYTFNQLGYRIVPWIRFERQMGHQVAAERRRTFLLEIDALTVLELLDVMFVGDRSPLRGLLYEALHGETLDRLIALADEHDFDDAYWTQAFEVISSALRARLAAHGVEAPELALTPETWRRSLALVMEAAGEQRDAAKAAYVALPSLDDLRDLPPMKACELQDPIDWGQLEHTPWPLGKVSPQTVYEFLGEEWWNKPVGELPAAAWGVREG
jgi:flavin-dependent dehydrogenase